MFLESDSCSLWPALRHPCRIEMEVKRAKWRKIYFRTVFLFPKKLQTFFSFSKVT